MKTARDIMTAQVITLGPDDQITKAARLLLDNHINAAPVVDAQGRLLGILCQSDLIAQQKRLPLPSFFTLLDMVIPLHSAKSLELEVAKISAFKVAQAMTPDPVTITPETGLEEIAALMVEKNFHTLPVVEDGLLKGVVGKEDILRTLMPGGK
jgi:CBS domain-containing protein